MINFSERQEIVFRRIIVVLLYISLISMFLAGAFRRVAPWIKAYHVSWSPKIIITLVLLHLWSVRNLIATVFASKFKDSHDKIRYSIVLSLILTLIAMFVTAYLRKIDIIIRDFHTMYLPTLLTTLIIMHIFAQLRRKDAFGKIQIRKDYKWFSPPLISILIILTTITAIIVIILQKIAVQ